MQAKLAYKYAFFLIFNSVRCDGFKTRIGLEKTHKIETV